jgi:hypothetical protein
MDRWGWRAVVLNAIEQHHVGDDEKLDLLSLLLEEQDAARQALRDNGYGCVGMPWASIVKEIPTRTLSIEVTKLHRTIQDVLALKKGLTPDQVVTLLKDILE